MEVLSNIPFDEIKIGDVAHYNKTLTESDLILFAATSGDVNPVHLDEDYAKQTLFKGRIAHGMWSGGLVSAALATVMPGPGTIYLNQSLSFKRPVKLNDELSVQLIAKEKNAEKHTVKFQCLVANQDGKTVVEGEAEVIAPTDKVSIEKPNLPEIAFG